MFSTLPLTLYQTTNRILDYSKLEKVADDDFKLDENDSKFSERGENIAGKGVICPEGEKILLVTSNFSFSQSVFKRLVLQTHKN